MQVLYKGSTTASYFWDDGSGINGDTGAPASGLPMQKGLAASPSWPMGTKATSSTRGRRPSSSSETAGRSAVGQGHHARPRRQDVRRVDGRHVEHRVVHRRRVGGMGHIPIEYVITEWGPGPGKKGAPKPFSTGAYRVVDDRVSN